MTLASVLIPVPEKSTRRPTAASAAETATRVPLVPSARASAREHIHGNAAKAARSAGTRAGNEDCPAPASVRLGSDSSRAPPLTHVAPSAWSAALQARRPAAAAPLDLQPSRFSCADESASASRVVANVASRKCATSPSATMKLFESRLATAIAMGTPAARIPSGLERAFAFVPDALPALRENKSLCPRNAYP